MKREEYVRIVNLYITDIYRFAYSGCKNIHDAEDITQDTFEALFLSKKKFESDEHIRNWLMRVAYYKCKSLWRTSWKNRVDFAEIDSSYLESEIGTIGNQDEEKLWKAICSLSSKYSQVIHLFYFEEMKVKEIAEVLGVSESLVTTRLTRAREKIRRIMER